MKKLRPYQQNAVVAALAAIRRGKSGTVQIATGGGKTLVASEVVRRLEGKHVLWVAKGWILLKQAADSLGAQAPELSKARWGGADSAIGKLPEALCDADVLFTTLHTFFSRLQGEGYPGANAPALIIWDECHWGEGSLMARQLVKYARQQGCPILGLTATPRAHSELPIVHQTTFGRLVSMGYLATPLIEEPLTHRSWSPQRTSAGGDFTPRSLRELGSDEARNRIIVQYWRQHSRVCERTIIFACDVAHAERLACALKKCGAAVGVVHSQLPEEDNELEIKRYQRGEIDVLVNVAMLTHGFDAPGTRTIFLTRPTASPILSDPLI